MSHFAVYWTTLYSILSGSTKCHSQMVSTSAS